MEGTMAEVRLFGGNFAPRNWAFCQGQLLAISQNQALFSLLGTIYGGDGRTSFALPDLRGRTMVGPGTGPGLTTRREGQRSGTQTNTLNVNNLPSHSHIVALTPLSAFIGVSASNGDTRTGTGNAIGKNTTDDDGSSTKGDLIYDNSPTFDELNRLSLPATTVPGSSVTILNNGGQQAFTNLQPFLGLNYIICLQGVFPSRS